MYFSTGSSRAILPSSTSIIIATAVIGFDSEAIQKSVSGVMGRFASMSAQPTQSTATVPFASVNSATAPASSPRSTKGVRSGGSGGCFGEEGLEEEPGKGDQGKGGFHESIFAFCPVRGNDISKRRSGFNTPAPASRPVSPDR
jgi:hypothetical protein